MFLELSGIFFLAFFCTWFIFPPFIFFMKKFFPKRIQADIRPGVYALHQQKQGTPHMGGLPLLVVSTLISLGFTLNREIVLVLVIGWGFALWGMMDDVLSSYGQKRLGLSPLVKLCLQILWSVVISFLFYSVTKIDWMYIPLYNQKIILGYWMLPLIWLVFVSTTNAVNITDGLDQLAGSLLLLCFIFFAWLAYDQDNQTLLYFLVALCGALLVFLYFNRHPARIFMGDTGSLSLGGILATVAFLTGWPLLLPLLGFPFVLETSSVIVQNVSKKFFHKKVLLISPLHHHFEKLGYPEKKIVGGFLILGSMCFIICLLLI